MESIRSKIKSIIEELDDSPVAAPIAEGPVVVGRRVQGLLDMLRREGGTTPPPPADGEDVAAVTARVDTLTIELNEKSKLIEMIELNNEKKFNELNKINEIKLNEILKENELIKKSFEETIERNLKIINNLINEMNLMN